MRRYQPIYFLLREIVFCTEKADRSVCRMKTRVEKDLFIDES
jgi:hypothetical protein